MGKKKRNVEKEKYTLERILGRTYPPLCNDEQKKLEKVFNTSFYEVQKFIQRNDLTFGYQRPVYERMVRMRQAAKKIIPSLIGVVHKGPMHMSSLDFMLGDLAAFPSAVYDDSAWSSWYEGVATLYFLEYFAEEKNDAFFTMLAAFPDQEEKDDTGITSYPDGLGYSAAQMAKFSMIIRQRKKSREAKEFFEAMLALYGEEQVVSLLHDVAMEYDALLRALSDTNITMEQEHYNQTQAHQDFRSMKKSYSIWETTRHDGFYVPTSLTSVKENLVAYTPFALAEPMFFVKTVAFMGYYIHGFPESLSACSSLRQDFVEELQSLWKEGDARRLASGLLLTEYYHIPYYEFPSLTQFIAEYARDHSESIFISACKEEKIDGAENKPPMVSIDKPIYQTDARYVRWLKDLESKSFEEFCEHGLCPEGKFLLSIRQILSAVAPSVSLPNDYQIDPSMRQQLEKLGVGEREAILYGILYDISLSGSRSLGLDTTYETQEDINNFLKELQEKGIESLFPDDEKEAEPVMNTLGEERLEKELTEEKQRVKGLAKALRQINHDKRVLEKENGELAEKVKEGEGEASRLRDALFSLQNEDETEEEAVDETITFPYDLKKNVIVFGGMATFLTHLHDAVPALRLESSLKADLTALIRNADAIYLQTNAIRHSMYFSINDIAKKEGKTVRYLKSSSSRRCALQIIKEVMGEKAG